MPKPVEKIAVKIDSREQRPWALNEELFVTERVTLTTGDYSIAGLEDRFAIERKSLGDAVSTFIHQWVRFRHELNRLSCFDLALIVIEADISDVMEHRYESEADPMSVLGRINAITIDTGIPVCFWGKRDNCVAMVERFLLQAHKKLNGGG